MGITMTQTKNRKAIIETRYQKYTQEDYYEMFSDEGGWLEYDHPAWGEVDEFVWSYNPAFQLDTLFYNKEAFIVWMNEELQRAAVDHREAYYQEMKEWWLTSSYEDPIIVAQGTDMNWYLWDGSHSIGITVQANLETAPAFVGTRIK